MTGESNRKVWRLIRPTFILFIISVIVTSLLAMTYGVTAPAIESNKIAAEEKAAKEVLGDQHGIAVKGQSKSYGGKLEVMVGVDDKGEITGVKVLSHQDTPGLGTKAMTSDYLAQYAGLSILKAEHIRQDGQVEAVTGATISSNGVYQAVKAALEEYHKTGGDGK